MGEMFLYRVEQKHNSELRWLQLHSNYKHLTDAFLAIEKKTFFALIKFATSFMRKTRLKAAFDLQFVLTDSTKNTSSNRN